MLSSCRKLGTSITVLLAGAAPALTSGLVVGFPVLIAREASANRDLDRQFGMETVGCLRSWDNIDGLFAEYVATAYRDYFSRQSRFIQQNLSKTDPVFENSKLPYHKIIEDTAILSQLARVSRSETLIRTKIIKEGPQYRVNIAWLHSPKMDLLATDEFILKETEDGKGFSQEEIKKNLGMSLDRLIAKVPFLGAVTGRDNSSITVNIGKSAKIKPGDTFVIATLEEVKKHPLLKEIVDWRFNTTGKIKVEQVEEGMAFCKLIEEEPNHQIARYQKIIQIIEAPSLPTAEVQAAPEIRSNENDFSWRPTYGWLSGSLWLGSFSRDFSNADAVAKSGGGLLLGGRAFGQLWLTREWLTELGYGYGFWSHSQQDIASGTTTTSGASGSATDLNLAAGYSLLAGDNPFGPKVWVKLGYHSISYTLPVMGAEKLAPASFNSLYLGIGGEMPLRSNWSGQMDLKFGFLPSGSETGGTSGSFQSTSDVQFFIGAAYRSSPRMTIRGGIEIIANSATYSSSSLSQKIVTFAPSVLYYF